LRYLEANEVSDAAQNLGDATAGKSLKKFQGQLADLDESPDDVYTPDQLEGLRHTVLRHLDADLAEFGVLLFVTLPALAESGARVFPICQTLPNLMVVLSAYCRCYCLASMRW
jgi:hypothetical protein